MTDRILRGLPNFKGKRRIAKLLCGDKIRYGKDITVGGSWGCKYKLPNLSEYLALEIFVNGMYEPDTHTFLFERIARGGYFLDLGANIGSIAIPLCKRRGDIKCIAVEAAPWVFDYLQHNVSINHLEQQISCVNKAITDTQGKQLPFYSPVDQFGKGSLSPVFTNQAYMVNTTTIDTLQDEFKIGAISTIKIDIEGFEFFAFKGGQRLLSAPNAPDIIFEFVDWAEDMAGLGKGTAQKLLKEYGYSIYVIDNSSLAAASDIITKGDFLFFASKKKLKD